MGRRTFFGTLDSSSDRQTGSDQFCENLKISKVRNMVEKVSRIIIIFENNLKESC
jgi:hypothetical protein